MPKAFPPRRFAVRWPAPYGGSSFGWRLIFWILFYQEKSIIEDFCQNQKSFVSLHQLLNHN